VDGQDALTKTMIQKRGGEMLALTIYREGAR